MSQVMPFSQTPMDFTAAAKLHLKRLVKLRLCFGFTMCWIVSHERVECLRFWKPALEEFHGQGLRGPVCVYQLPSVTGWSGVHKPLGQALLSKMRGRDAAAT